MSFGSKIQMLRKDKGLSQKALARELNVSRQAVSKWETDEGYPEIDKIILMSDLFQVSLDYLMKDQVMQEKQEGYFFSHEKIKEYKSFQQKMGFVIGGSVSGIILSTIIPLVLHQTQYENLGNVLMLLVVACCVFSLIMAGMSSEKYKYLKQEDIHISYDDQHELNEQYTRFLSLFKIGIAFGVFMIIVAVALSYYLDELFHHDGITGGVLLFVVAVAVFMFIDLGMQHQFYQILLHHKEFIAEQKKSERSLFALTMPLAAMVYLIIGFVYHLWHPGWIIFPIVAIITSFFDRRKNNSDI